MATVFFTLLILYVIIVLALPIRWPAIRGTFHRQLTRRLHDELAGVYLPIPEDVSKALEDERRQIELLLAEVREVAEWLVEREQAADIGGLYGN